MECLGFKPGAAGYGAMAATCSKLFLYVAMLLFDHYFV